MSYTRAQIEAARRNQERIQARLGERVFAQDGTMDFKIDARLFHNARISEQRDHGVADCWKEQEFVRDMCRRHPEIAVKSRPRKLTVLVSKLAKLAPDMFRGDGRLTRFGRTTFHKRYA